MIARVDRYQQVGFAPVNLRVARYTLASRTQTGKPPSMRRPVGVKWVLWFLRWTRLFLPAEAPLSPPFHPHFLDERFCFARCKLGVLVSAGAATCLSTSRSISRWKLGQAINAVTGTRRLGFVFPIDEPGLCRCRQCDMTAICAAVRRLPRSRTNTSSKSCAAIRQVADLSVAEGLTLVAILL
jgi:hypothetical protein